MLNVDGSESKLRWYQYQQNWLKNVRPLITTFSKPGKINIDVGHVLLLVNIDRVCVLIKANWRVYVD